MNYDLALLHVVRLMMLAPEDSPALPPNHGLSIKKYLWEHVGRRAQRISGVRMPTDLDELLEVRRMVEAFRGVDLEPRMVEAIRWFDVVSARLLRPELEALLRRLPKEPPKQRQRLYAVPSQEEDLPHAN